MFKTMKKFYQQFKITWWKLNFISNSKPSDATIRNKVAQGHPTTKLNHWCGIHFIVVFFFFLAGCNKMDTFQKGWLFERCPKNIFSQISGIVQIFFRIIRHEFMFFLVSSPGSLPWVPIMPKLFLIAELWKLNLTEASEVCCALDVLGS